MPLYKYYIYMLIFGKSFLLAQMENTFISS